MFRERTVICGDPDLSGPIVGRTHRFAPTKKQYLNVYGTSPIPSGRSAMALMVSVIRLHSGNVVSKL